jgi:adenosylcobinamide kinase/adenosylcobinamide-phosphate guanylyltransferase
MIPYGQAGAERVERHRKFRAGKGFRTIEAPFDIDTAVTSLKETSDINLADMTVLLECVSNLVANELFERHATANELIERLYMDIRHIAEQCRNLVIVTNHFETEDGFDEETRMYAETLDILNGKLGKFADNTIRL